LVLINPTADDLCCQCCRSVCKSCEFRVASIAPVLPALPFLLPSTAEYLVLRACSSNKELPVAQYCKYYYYYYFGILHTVLLSVVGVDSYWYIAVHSLGMMRRTVVLYQHYSTGSRVKIPGSTVPL
jgi:hypothetical protein